MKIFKIACAIGASLVLTLANAQNAEFPIKAAYTRALDSNPTYQGTVLSPSKGKITVQRTNPAGFASFASVKNVDERDVLATLTLDSAKDKPQLSLERNYYTKDDRYVGSVTGKVENSTFKPSAYERVTEFHTYPKKAKIGSTGLLVKSTIYSDDKFKDEVKKRTITYELKAIEGSTVTALLNVISKDTDGVTSTASFRISTDGDLIRLSERSETTTFLLDVMFNK